MKYMGSKNRHSKQILDIVLSYRESEDHLYYEPFVGGANVIDKVTGNRAGSDNHPYLVSMLRAAADGWMPPQEMTELQYNDIRQNKGSYEPELVGYAGFALSYSGKWFGGWCRDGAGKRNYVGEAYRNAEKQFPKLVDCNFWQANFSETCVPQGSLIYCDPPYEGTTKYKSKFDHEMFWCWVRNVSKHSKVFVSEYNAPDDFECIWEKPVNSSLTKDTGSRKATEKLFKLRGIA